jgi:hypothetical protein
MKYFMLAACGLVALISGLAFTREFAFIGPLTSWPILVTTVASLVLMVVRKPWKIMAAGMALIAASLLELVGAFFTFIIVMFWCVGTTHTGLGHAAVDLVVLVVVAGMSMVTSWLALGWGVWHTIRTPRQVLHPMAHA